MKMSNNPGNMIVKINEAGNAANVTFNEVERYNIGDGLVFLKYGGVTMPMSAAPQVEDSPEAYVLTFGGAVTLTYTDPNSKTVTVDEI